MDATPHYEASGLHKTASEDSYEHGELATGGTDAYLDHTFSAESVASLVEQLRQFVPFPVEDGSIELDACDEPGRIDLYGRETIDGNEPRARDIEDWRRGDYRLWSVTYTVYVKRVTRETVSLKEH